MAVQIGIQGQHIFKTIICYFVKEKKITDCTFCRTIQHDSERWGCCKTGFFSGNGKVSKGLATYLIPVLTN